MSFQFPPRLIICKLEFPVSRVSRALAMEPSTNQDHQNQNLYTDLNCCFSIDQCFDLLFYTDEQTIEHLKLHSPRLGAGEWG